ERRVLASVRASVERTNDGTRALMRPPEDGGQEPGGPCRTRQRCPRLVRTFLLVQGPITGGHVAPVEPGVTVALDAAVMGNGPHQASRSVRQDSSPLSLLIGRPWRPRFALARALAW